MPAPSPKPSLKFTFTDRTGGVSAPPYDTLNLASHVGDDPLRVAENRRRAAPDGTVWMQQVHGSAVAVVDRAGEEPVAGVDGLVTSTPELALGVLVADCVPVVLADLSASVVGVAHAGRRGLVAGVVGACFARMVECGARPQRSRAWLGPSICPGCYALSAAEATAVTELVPAAAGRARSGAPAIDLAAGVRAQLAALGLPAAAVRVSQRCTAEDTRLFSYRRDSVTGRFAGLARLSSEP